MFALDDSMNYPDNWAVVVPLANGGNGVGRVGSALAKEMDQLAGGVVCIHR